MSVEINHPSFGALEISRVSGDAELYMSPHRHQHYITLRIMSATFSRDLHEDRHFATGRLPYVEVAMSEAQWAHAISSLNMGGGTPCTITRRWAHMEGFERVAPPPRHVATRSEFDDELKEQVREALALVEEAMKTVADMMAGKAPNKGQLKELRDKLRTAHQQGGVNLEFTLQQFERAMDRATQSAKADIEAAHLSGVREIALAAIQQELKAAPNALRLLGIANEESTDDR